MADVWSRAWEGAESSEPNKWSDGRMYAVAFDLDTAACKAHYPGTDWRHAYGDIQRVMEQNGFWGQQGSVYYSNHGKASRVFQLVMALKEKLPWFRLVVRDFRMLRVEENDDLLPLLGQPELPLDKSRIGRRERPFGLN